MQEKLDKLKSILNSIELKEKNEKEWKELLAEILKRLKECTSVSIVFDDLMMEVERKIDELKNRKIQAIEIMDTASLSNNISTGRDGKATDAVILNGEYSAEGSCNT